MEEEHAVPVRPCRHEGLGVAVAHMPVVTGTSSGFRIARWFCERNIRPESQTNVLQRRCAREDLQFKREKTSGEYSVEKLILGTHTSEGEQNHLMIAEARIPNDNADIDGTKYQDREGGMLHPLVNVRIRRAITLSCG